MDSCCGEVEKVDAGLITRRPGSLPATATNLQARYGSVSSREDQHRGQELAMMKNSLLESLAKSLALSSKREDASLSRRTVRVKIPPGPP